MRFLAHILEKQMKNMKIDSRIIIHEYNLLFQSYSEYSYWTGTRSWWFVCWDKFKFHKANTLFSKMLFCFQMCNAATALFKSGIYLIYSNWGLVLLSSCGQKQNYKVDYTFQSFMSLICIPVTHHVALNPHRNTQMFFFPNYSHLAPIKAFFTLSDVTFNMCFQLRA